MKTGATQTKKATFPAWVYAKEKEHQLIFPTVAEYPDLIFAGKAQEPYPQIGHAETDGKDRSRMHPGRNQCLRAHEGNTPDSYDGEG